MAWKTKATDTSLISEINITPLTDVMLVLLVIFMVTTPLIIIDSFKVKLPKAAGFSAEPGLGIIISVSKAGKVAVDGTEVEIEGLSAVLKKEFAADPDKAVVVKADGGTLHGVVVKVLDTAKLAGARRLSIATERSDGPGS